MGHRGSGRILILVTIGLLSVVRCYFSSPLINHLIPGGYVGPVVIVYESINGEKIGHDGINGIVYKIPPNGVLRLSAPPPASGRARFYYVGPDGSRQEIRYRSDNNTLQVFAYIDGVAGEGSGGKKVRWSAYVVGIPDEREDWLALRTKATEAALGLGSLQ